MKLSGELLTLLKPSGELLTLLKLSGELLVLLAPSEVEPVPLNPSGELLVLLAPSGEAPEFSRQLVVSTFLKPENDNKGKVS